MASYIDDLTLIQRFVDGEATLMANQHLRVESSLDTVQLLARSGAIIAIARLSETTKEVEVNTKSSYWQSVHQVLEGKGFVPTGQTSDRGLARYQKLQVPPGYKMHYTEAMNLWRNWWARGHQAIKRNLQLELLVMCRGQWYPIREITTHTGQLHIKTLVGEIILHGTELVAWLSREDKNRTDAQPQSHLARRYLGRGSSSPTMVGSYSASYPPAPAEIAAAGGGEDNRWDTNEPVPAQPVSGPVTAGSRRPVGTPLPGQPGSRAVPSARTPAWKNNEAMTGPPSGNLYQTPEPYADVPVVESTVEQATPEEALTPPPSGIKIESSRRFMASAAPPTSAPPPTAARIEGNQQTTQGVTITKPAQPWQYVGSKLYVDALVGQIVVEAADRVRVFRQESDGELIEGQEFFKYTSDKLYVATTRGELLIEGAKLTFSLRRG